ncbi:MAG: NrfD/PsrC family molybdoenzyme membrane anchor subunit [Planctomycetota bacterium]
MNFGFVIDNRKCIGCHACTVACKSEHDVPVGVNRTWVKYIEKGEFPNTQRLFSVMRCNHCQDAPCVDICPTTALFIREDGIVDFDNRRCIGCKACIQACPYDAIYIDPQNLTAAKCNYCTHRVDLGLEPACVNVCPTHAIISGDLENPNSEIAQLVSREKVQVRKPEKGTYPKLFYIEGDQLSLDPSLTDKMSQYVWSQQSSGVGHFAAQKTEMALSPTLKQTQGSSFKRVLQQAKNTARRVYDVPDKGILWGWEVSAYILTKAIATGLFLVFFCLHLARPLPFKIHLFTGFTALLFLGLTTILLVLDLDQPKRFFYVLLRPHWKSWLVRGAYILVGYTVLLVLWLSAHYFEFPRFVLGLSWICCVFAVLTAIYTAFLFAQSKGRDFWQSPLLPLHMLCHALLTGIAFPLIASVFWSDLTPFVSLLSLTLKYGIVLHLFLLGTELLTTHSTKDAQKTVKIITQGRFKTLFWGGVVLLGNILPLVLLLFGPAIPLMGAVSSVFVFLGLWFSIQIWVIAPQLIPLS